MTGPATEPRDDFPALEQLPPAVQARVVALTAQVLPDVPRLPASLRKVATFAVARRARHGGPAILAALDDEDFRDRVGVLAAAQPAVDTAPAGVAARLWLVRPEGAAAALGGGAGRSGGRSGRDGGGLGPGGPADGPGVGSPGSGARPAGPPPGGAPEAQGRELRPAAQARRDPRGRTGGPRAGGRAGRGAGRLPGGRCGGDLVGRGGCPPLAGAGRGAPRGRHPRAAGRARGSRRRVDAGPAAAGHAGGGGGRVAARAGAAARPPVLRRTGWRRTRPRRASGHRPEPRRRAARHCSTSSSHCPGCT